MSRVDTSPCPASEEHDLSRAEWRRPKDASAYIRPLAEHQVPACHAKPTGKAAETKGRQGVHPTPCKAASAAPATQKLPAERRRPRDARGYIRPLAEQQVLRLPCKTYRQSGGDQGTPGRTSDPLQSTKCRACHAKATGRAAETKGRQGVHPTPCRAASAAPATQKAAETKGRQGVHPTPCRAASAVPATQKAAETKGHQGVHPISCRAPTAAPATQKPPETKGRQGVHPTPCRAPSAAPATQKPPETKGRQGVHPTPCRAPSHTKATGRAAETKGRQGVHPTPCRAASAAPATQNLPAERQRPRDARAYIRPLAEQQVPRLPRKRV